VYKEDGTKLRTRNNWTTSHTVQSVCS